MNTTIETLNELGERLYSLGWPILWQSSLLIVIVFCLDYLLAKKVRAAVLYALWLAVLVKLLLPPTLALPTGVAWWLTPAKPVAPPPVARHYTVTYGETVPLPDYELPSVPLPPPPPPKLELSGWLLLAATAVSAILLLWLMVRWWQVARMVRRASPPEEFSRPLADALRLAGASVRLKMVDGRMSPAVCGLFRPVILLPRELAERLSPEQLRAVLLHELFHLRRGDVWVNCAQALLQIVYWWHPLLWFANARIRRLREEAVDDAVMLALRDEADSYAPTLLEVAKLALRRPLLSLGLVGIMESRSALRQRIERLVDFRAPRKAGLTFASFLAICVFSAVALPMGEAPAVEHPDNNAGILPEPTNAVMSGGRGENKIVLPAISAPATVTMVSSMPTNQPAVIIQGEFYRMRQSDFEKLVSDPAFVASKKDQGENFRQFNQLLKASGFQPISRPRIQTFDGMPAELYVGNETNSIEFECSPGVTNGLVDLASRIKIISPAENATTTNELSNRTVLESGGGHVFSIKTGDASSGSNLVVVTIGVQIVTNAAGFHQRLHTVVNRPGGNNSTATNVTVGAVSNMLNDPNFRFVVHALEQRSSAEFLAEPEVVTTSGRGRNRISMPSISAAFTNANLSYSSRRAASVSYEYGLPYHEDLLRDGKRLYEMGRFDEAQKKLKAALALDPENTPAKYYLDLVQASLVQTNGNAAKLIYTGPGRQVIVRKLETIRLNEVAFKAVPLAEVLRTLAAESKKRDIDQRGINFLINPYLEQVVDGFVRKIDPATGLPVETNAAASMDLGGLPITFSQTLTNAKLADVLDAVVLVSPKPIKYSVQDFAIVFSPYKPSVRFFSRTFAVNVQSLAAGLRRAGVSLAGQTNSTTQIMEAFRKYLTGLGVDWETPMGKSLFYSDGRERLFVKATTSDLDTIERAIGNLMPPPQIHIKARFVQVPREVLEGTGIINALSHPLNDGPTGILSRTNAQFLWKTLQASKEVKFLAEPEVTTISGRQTQVRATTKLDVITGVSAEQQVEMPGVVVSNNVTFKTEPVETGPILDSTATVLADGYTINLRVKASVTEFFGYAPARNSGNAQTANINAVTLPEIRPSLRSREALFTAYIYDGQTLVLGNFTEKTSGKENIPKQQDKELLVFVTVTIVDPAGNRVHKDGNLPSIGDMPRVPTGIPSQPSQAIPGHYDDVNPNGNSATTTQ